LYKVFPLFSRRANPLGIQSIFKVLDPAPFLPEMADEEQVKSKYKYWRHRIFYSMLIGYALYYFTRRSLIFAMPGLIADLGFDKSQLGILGSVLSITYGLSKFISGVLADKSNPRYFMALGLFLTGICNICFGLSSSLVMFVVFWGANGFFQGFGWPACARSLTNWYSHSERGAWWSSASVAHNLGAFTTPWIVGLTLQYFGWRSGMFVPGIVCILGAFFLINRLRDAPQTLGLPPIEKFRDDYQGKPVGNEEAKISTLELLKGVLSNKYIWLLAFAYFFLYILRMGISDWTGLFLYEVKGYGALGSSGASSLFEAGGFFGCLAAGWASDRLFGANRVPVCVLFAVGILGSILLFWMVPAGYVMFDWVTIFLMGFTVYGPQMLIGICASELCHKKAAATANGFVGWVAYIGAAVSGYPMGLVIDRAGWNGAFVCLLVCSLLCISLLLPLWAVNRATVEKKELLKA
jgi:MFS transporter, OPA family, sugar phosphate sensor protein UhpC